jgi:hypothetical protein
MGQNANLGPTSLTNPFQSCLIQQKKSIQNWFKSVSTSNPTTWVLSFFAQLVACHLKVSRMGSPARIGEKWWGQL